MSDLETAIHQAVSPQFRGSLLDLGLARGLIWREGNLPPSAQDFAPSLSCDLLDYGYGLLSMSLALRDARTDSFVLEEGLLRAAEAIEAVVSRGARDSLESGSHRVTAAVAYHLARHPARAYSMLRFDEQDPNLSPAEHALALLLRRSLGELSQLVGSWLLGAGFEGPIPASHINHQEDFDQGDAVTLALTRALMRGLALFDHALATGRTASVVAARNVLVAAADAAAAFGSTRHWWTLRLARHLVEELWDNSLHSRLPKCGSGADADCWDVLRSSYIQRLRRKDRAALEVWPSQVEAAARCVDPYDNLVVSLPTSAGKTLIAELCILRCLAGGRRVVYVTPLRALSRQVERDLASSLCPLGFSVSSLYGVVGLESWDDNRLKNHSVVVATPEKLDFAVRSDPALLDDVGLIVLDEGHMLGTGEREIRYEALVQRLLGRSDSLERRLVTLSALFPPPDELADLVAWVRKDRQGGAIHSRWRPTRQRFGTIRWQDDHAWLELEVGTKKVSVARFVEACTPPSSSPRQNTFPSSKNELVIASAWVFAQQGKDVLIYCPLRKSVEALGQTVLKCIRQGVLSDTAPFGARVEAAKAIGREWLGASHPAVKCLDHGVALHHAGLPRPFLLAVEEVIRAQDCRVTIASPTLAQGMNLSASVLVLSSLWRSQELIPPSELANVSGRAGRAFVDMDGLVLLVVHEDKPGKAWKRTKEWAQLRAVAKARRIESGLLHLAVDLLDTIAGASFVSPEQVLAYLTGQDDAWSQPGHSEYQGGVESHWEDELAVLDTALLSLLDAETPDSGIPQALADALRGSLFSRQLERLTEEMQGLIWRFLAARGIWIWSRTTARQRRGYYLCGIGVGAGTSLHDHLNQLVAHLLTAEVAIAEGQTKHAVSGILAFARLAFQMRPFRPPGLLATDWEAALEGWLVGWPGCRVLEAIGKGGTVFLQDSVGYRLAWAIEAVRVHAQTIGHPDAEFLTGLPALAVQTGSLNQSVMTLVRMGLASRNLASAIAAATSATFVDSDGMRSWLESDEVVALVSDPQWPDPDGHAELLAFLSNTRADNRRPWTRAGQSAVVEWSQRTSPPAAGTPVVIREHEGSILVLLPELTPLGRLRSRLRRSPNDVVDAWVGEDQMTVELRFFGPHRI